MPKRKKQVRLKAKPARVLPRTAKLFFKGKDAFPVGQLTRSHKGSLFGSLLNETPQAKELVFHLEALKEHLAEVAKHQKYREALPGSIGHTAISIFPEKNKAVITIIQGTADLKKTKLTNEQRRGYRNWHLATLISAISYCRNRGIKVYAISPKNYGDMSDPSRFLERAKKDKAFRKIAGASFAPETLPEKLPFQMSDELASFYGQTLKKVAQSFKLNLHEVKTKQVLGQENVKFFSPKLVQIL